MDTTNIVYALSNSDLNTLKRFRDIATIQTNTFISFTEDLVRDNAGNRVVPIQSTSARRVSMVTPDSTAPVLIGFLLDLEGSTGLEGRS